ncbi:MAG: GNAT family N-acetyltransferase [Gammaproteobacteria bacterium]|nr:GNAT family N-acetyltransferase [Gammaproteobacteria bacterium]
MHMSDSQRLKFRLMDRSDAQHLFELDQDPEVMKYIDGGRCTSWDKIKTILLPRMEKYRNPEKGWGIWMVSIKETNEYVGWILVRPMHFFTELRDDSDIELGWRFKQLSWGKGYATEAAKKISDELVSKNPDIKSFSAIADPDNTASINIMEKLGMKFLKQDIFRDPLIETEVVYYSHRVN